MTTAHRPTLRPAVANSNLAQGGYFTGGQVSKQFSVRDMTSHTKLKIRQPGQGVDADLARRDLKAELEAREAKHFEAVRKERAAAAGGAIAAIEEVAALAITDVPAVAPGDAEDELALFNDSDDSDSSSSSSSDDDDDDDDTAALMRELEKIKAERAARQAEAEAEAKALEDAEAKAAVLAGNPLLAPSGAGSKKAASAVIKRRWDDDVVFRNQARDEPKAKKRFINDTIRNDFHRRFLNKFIK